MKQAQEKYDSKDCAYGYPIEKFSAYKGLRLCWSDYIATLQLVPNLTINEDQWRCHRSWPCPRIAYCHVIDPVLKKRISQVG